MKKKKTRVERRKKTKDPVLIANMKFSLENMNDFIKSKPRKLDTAGMHAIKFSLACFLFGKTGHSNDQESTTLNFWKVLDKSKEETLLLQSHLQSRIESFINKKSSSVDDFIQEFLRITFIMIQRMLEILLYCELTTVDYTSFCPAL